MILIIGITIAFFLEFLLISKKNKNRADRILAVWMFIIGLHLFLRYLIESGLIFKIPFLFGINLPFPLLHGPFLLFYVQELSNQKPKKLIYNYIHFLFPALLYLYLIQYFILSDEMKIITIKNNGADYKVFNVILFLGANLSGVVYVFWCVLLLKKHKTNIANRFSYSEKINLNWLRQLTYGLGVIWFAVITSNFIVSDWLDQHLEHSGSIIYNTLVVFVIIIGFYGVKQVGIFSGSQNNFSIDEFDVPKFDNSKSIPEAKMKEQRYMKSGLTTEKMDDLHKKLLLIMKTEKPFLNNELSLKDIALKLDIHPNYLSQVINDRMGKNFYDFVNEYRVNEFKKLLNKPNIQNFTMLALAYECGFNSKSSFNKYFRKSTGITPSEFSKTVKKQD